MKYLMNWLQAHEIIVIAGISVALLVVLLVFSFFVLPDLVRRDVIALLNSAGQL